MTDYTRIQFDCEIEIEKISKTEKLFVGEYAIEDYARVEFDIDYSVNRGGELSYEIDNVWVNGEPATPIQLKTVLDYIKNDKEEQESLYEFVLWKAQDAGENVYGASDWAHEHSTYY